MIATALTTTSAASVSGCTVIERVHPILFMGQDLAQTKVCQFHMALLVDQDVVWFQVSVDCKNKRYMYCQCHSLPVRVLTNVVVVKELQGANDFARVESRLLIWKRSTNGQPVEDLKTSNCLLVNKTTWLGQNVNKHTSPPRAKSMT